MGANSVLSHGRVRALGLAAKGALKTPDDLPSLIVTVELLITEASKATDLTALAIADFRDEVRQHKGSYVATRQYLNATFRVARWAFSGVSDLAIAAQGRGAVIGNADLHQATFKRMTRLQEDFYELLADMAEEKLQERISEAFKASLEGKGRSFDWRHLVFDEPQAQ